VSNITPTVQKDGMATTLQKYRCASIDIGVVNLAFCVTEFTARPDGTFSFDLVHVQRVKIGNMTETIHNLGKKLLSFYSSNDALQNERLDYVFIEQQLSRAVKNNALAYVTMAYFETKRLICDGNTTVFVSPKKKFTAVQYVFSEDLLHPINFDRNGKELKKLSVEVARLLFVKFRVEVGLDALIKYGTKLDDVSDVFLQSFAFFLEKVPLKSAARGGRSFLIGVEEHGQSEHADEQA